MPNTFAFVMLFGWPLVALVLFRTLPLSKALIWTILGGYLVLPSATIVELPLLPALDKSIVPTLSALLFGLIFAPRLKQDRTFSTPDLSANETSGRKLVYALLALLVASPFFTAFYNQEPIIVGPRFVTGLGLYDAVSMLSGVLVSILPFFLGWRYLSTRDTHVHLLQAFVIAALVYSLPVLFEVRMSPQLHSWVYGFFPHSFDQHFRNAGFRPVVFLGHGLLVGIFFCLAILAALALWREALREGRTSSGWIFAIVWLAGVLSMSKNLGALVIAVLLGLIVMFGGRRLQLTTTVFIAAVTILYPMLRGAGLVPVDTVHTIALSIDEERAGSLRFRFDNEDILLARANEKPLFGWGSWGRNHLYEPTVGRMITVTDGLWVILIGVFGWMGYLAHFGLLTVPILLFLWRKREFGPSLITPGLMIILGASLIDLLPNASLVPYVWLLAGAVTGFVLRRDVADEGPAQAEAARPATNGWPAVSGTGLPPPDWVMQGIERPASQAGRRRQVK